jgi:glyoxylase-like metal-dependent hydrolase (beta-lactamase superfamily II)
VAAVSEPAPGVHRLELPLGIHGVPSVNGWLLRDGDAGGDVLVDCGIAVGPDATSALADALRRCGSTIERVATLVVTHAHIDHFGLAGEVVRRSGGELWMHAATRLDLDKYADPEEAVDRRTLMLADHGLYGEELTSASEGLRDWMPVMPSIGHPTRLLAGGELLRAGGRSWEVVHTPGHSPGHVCLWSAADGVLCSGDHLLKIVSPPVTFERGFEPDPMGSYLDSLDRIRTLDPALVLPGHGDPFPDGARRAETIARGKKRRLAAVLDLVTAAGRTVTELTATLFGTGLGGAARHFAMAEVLAYLAYHEARGSAARLRRADGVFVWSATTTSTTSTEEALP